MGGAARVRERASERERRGLGFRREREAAGLDLIHRHDRGWPTRGDRGRGRRACVLGAMAPAFLSIERWGGRPWWAGLECTVAFRPSGTVMLGSFHFLFCFKFCYYFALLIL